MNNCNTWWEVTTDAIEKLRTNCDHRNAKEAFPGGHIQQSFREVLLKPKHNQKRTPGGGSCGEKTPKLKKSDCVQKIGPKFCLTGAWDE